MRYITDLNKETIKTLEQIIKNEERYKSRYRAQAILLSNQQKTINEIAEIFGVKIRTIYRWFDRFEKDNLEGIYELKGRGRKPNLTIRNDAKKVKEYIKKNSI
jgi:transposase